MSETEVQTETTPGTADSIPPETREPTAEPAKDNAAKDNAAKDNAANEDVSAGDAPVLATAPAEKALDEIVDETADEPEELTETEDNGSDSALHLERLGEDLDRGLAEIRTALERRIAHKDDQIDRLHRELQGYKTQMIERIKEPLLQGLVRLHDDLGKVVGSLRELPAEELTPRRVFSTFEGFEDDIELLLGQHGLERFEAPGEVFDPRRQTALRTEPAPEPERVGHLAARLRPGFEQGETLFQKERVAVYAAAPTTDTPQEPTIPNEG